MTSAEIDADSVSVMSLEAVSNRNPREFVRLGCGNLGNSRLFNEKGGGHGSGNRQEQKFVTE